MRPLLLAVLLLALAAPVASAQTLQFGFNDNAVAAGQVTAVKDAHLASQIGANSSRITFDWRWAEPQPGVWDLVRYDAIYKENLAKGIRTTFILMWAPSWADGVDCSGDCRYPPAAEHMDAWRNVVRKLVERYPQMGALEIWNEPNYASFWHGGLDPERYTSLLIEAHDTVRAAGSAIPVLGGSVMHFIEKDTATMMNQRDFIDRMYRAGAKGHMDGLAIHPYPHDVDLWRFFHTLSDARDVRAQHDDNTPIWVTEVGATTVRSTTTFWQSENDQALLLRKLYNELQGMPDVRAAWFHTLIDYGMAAASDPERGYGTLRIDLTPKPAYCMFAALRKTTYKCPARTAALKTNATQDARWLAQHYVQRAYDAARTYRVRNGTWVGISTAQLNAIDSGLSATEPNGSALPGTTADPTRVGVWVIDANTAAEKVLVCNSSKADRSYCIEGQWGRSPYFGSTAGNIYHTADRTIVRGVWGWD